MKTMDSRRRTNAALNAIDRRGIRTFRKTHAAYVRAIASIETELGTDGSIREARLIAGWRLGIHILHLSAKPDDLRALRKSIDRCRAVPLHMQLHADIAINVALAKVGDSIAKRKLRILRQLVDSIETQLADCGRR
ncbi:MAG: hypothetical protein JNM94_11585 [Phycisphaerae bacterium]|nr:hypothetical protein [Phycisphaerae bacterium]